MPDNRGLFLIGGLALVLWLVSRGKAQASGLTQRYLAEIKATTSRTELEAIYARSYADYQANRLTEAEILVIYQAYSDKVYGGTLVSQRHSNFSNILAGGR